MLQNYENLTVPWHSRVCNSSSPSCFTYVSAHVLSQIVFVSLGNTKGWLLGDWVLVQTFVYIQSPAKARVTKKILLYIDTVRSIRRLSLVIVCFVVVTAAAVIQVIA